MAADEDIDIEGDDEVADPDTDIDALEDVIDEDDLEEDLDGDLEDDDLEDEGDAEVVEVADVEEGVAAPPPSKDAPRKKRDEEDDDEEEDDPDDVEADLDRILKERIAASDDEEEDEEELEAEVVTRGAEAPDGVQPRKANEFMCPSCFLLVSAAQFGPPGARECPVGEGDCPAIGMLDSAPTAAPVVKAVRSGARSKARGAR